MSREGVGETVPDGAAINLARGRYGDDEGSLMRGQFEQLVPVVEVARELHFVAGDRGEEAEPFLENPLTDVRVSNPRIVQRVEPGLCRGDRGAEWMKRSLIALSQEKGSSYGTAYRPIGDFTERGSICSVDTRTAREIDFVVR